jgi:dsRNA-specific ribonuclease
MQTLHDGSGEFRHDTGGVIAYLWKFEGGDDHEHPYVLSVTLAEHTHSEGYTQDIGKAEASRKAGQLARELYETL